MQGGCTGGPQWAVTAWRRNGRVRILLPSGGRLGSTGGFTGVTALAIAGYRLGLVGEASGDWAGVGGVHLTWPKLIWDVKKPLMFMLSLILHFSCPYIYCPRHMKRGQLSLAYRNILFVIANSIRESSSNSNGDTLLLLTTFFLLAGRREGEGRNNDPSLTSLVITAREQALASRGQGY